MLLRKTQHFMLSSILFGCLYPSIKALPIIKFNTYINLHVCGNPFESAFINNLYYAQSSYYKLLTKLPSAGKGGNFPDIEYFEVV